MDLKITKGNVSDVSVLVNSTEVTIQKSNSINVEVTPQATQIITIDRNIIGATGNGIESVSIFYDGTTYYLDFLYTDGSTELVPLPATAAGVTSFNTRVGAVTLTSSDVTTALGYTPPTPTGTGASGTWAISVSGNSATVTNGVYTTGTYSDPLWLTALAASKITGTLTNSQLANSSITINGTPVSLGGSITTPQGTVTSVTGTSPIASTGGATPAISIPKATNAVDGYLSATDWTTFNAKGNGTVTSVTATSPVTSTGGATPVIAMPAATTSVSGYLTSTDWNTFNSKGTGTVTSVAATAGTGISVSGSPITSSGTFNIVNTAPDQVVSLTASTAISVTGTYPNFTIANTSPDQTVVLTAGTGISTSGTYPNFTITNSLPDQIVSLIGAGTTTVTGTYPNFTITSSGGGSMVYPAAGIPNSTGSAWGTSYGVTGTGDVVLSDNPTIYGLNTYDITSIGILQLAGIDTDNQVVATNQTSGSLDIGGLLGVSGNTRFLNGQTTGSLTIGGTGATGAITLGQSTGAQNINISNGAASTSIVNIGGTGASTGAINIGRSTGAQNINISNGATSTSIVNIGGTGASTGNINIGRSTGTQTISIGSGATGSTVTTGGTRTINIGTTSFQSGISNINIGKYSSSINHTTYITGRTVNLTAETLVFNNFGALSIGSNLAQTTMVVADLGSLTGVVQGSRSFVTDNLVTPVFNAIVTDGGGSGFATPIFYDGTNWRCG